MAPRRLVLVMILLLAVSTVVAIIAPNPSERTESGTGTTAGQEDRNRESEEQSVTDPVGDEPERAEDSGPQARTVTIETGGRIEVVPVEPDLRVVLEVRSGRTAEIEIPELGRTATADRWAPAVFDLVTPAEPGSLTVEDLSGRGTVARLVVG